jgi:CBS domain containing-hemolysin-like protein
MRVDYEQHLEECSHCRARQRLHRVIDVVLIGISTVSTMAFLVALAIIHHLEPLRSWSLVHLHLRQMSIVLSLQEAAFMGLLLSVLMWVLVAVATPVPVYLSGVAMEQARVLQERIPQELRGKLPKISA